MKYFIIAGEKSGDLHGANLVKELLRVDTGADIECWGGDKMQASGANLYGICGSIEEYPEHKKEYLIVQKSDHDFKA
jgi:lipid A disaccharide synthetase